MTNHEKEFLLTRYVRWPPVFVYVAIYKISGHRHRTHNSDVPIMTKYIPHYQVITFLV